MIYILLGCIAVFFLLIYPGIAQKKKYKRLRQLALSSWGKPKNEPYRHEQVEKYYLRTHNATDLQLSQQTVFDIDFHQLFSAIDRTSSRIGQQYLYKRLMQPVVIAQPLQKLDEQIQFFENNEELRQDIQATLLQLNDDDAYYVANIIGKDLLDKPQWVNYLYLSVLSIFILLIISVKYKLAIVLLLVPVVVNTYIHFWNKNNTHQFLKSFPQLKAMMNIAETIAKKELPFDAAALHSSIKALGKFRKQSWLLGLDQGKSLKDEATMMFTAIMEIVKGIFLIELFAVYRLARLVEDQQSSIQHIFDYVGEIDFTLSVASLRAGEATTCIPVFTAVQKQMAATALYHPLVERPVKNDFELTGKSYLITGSNMSGKTTFLRSVIINSILAQTINTCFADAFTTPFLFQHSSIRINDNLFQGKSYYFEEVSVMSGLIKQADTSVQNLFVLDEVFKGTNTVERIALAKAILSYLNKGSNLVFVATHDIELAEMLHDDYDLYHFAETVLDEKLHFDYLLKPGPLRNRNAIRILEISGYPKEITDEARRISGNAS